MPSAFCACSLADIQKMGHNRKKTEFWFLTVCFGVLLASLLLFPNFVLPGGGEDNMFTVSLNGETVGVTSSREEAEACFRQARREIAKTSSEMLFIDADLKIEGKQVNWGRTDSDSDIVDRMKTVLSRHELLTLQHCYTVKIGEYIFNMASVDDIKSLLNEVLEQYDPERDYVVSILSDTGREVNALTYEVLTTSEQEKKDEKQNQLPSAGIEQEFSRLFENVKPAVGKDFEDYVLGLQKIDFGEKVEISETYLPSTLVASLEEAKADVTGDVARSAVYEVTSGDTLSGIASKYGLSTQQLISINGLSGEDAVIRPGDVLSVTVAEPKLTVLYTNQEYYEEDYQADVIYKENSDWYTTKSEVIQTGSPGHRRVIALVNYRDDTVQSREIVKQETTVDAVPQIIEVGTKNPPTYIWPVYGRVSSTFGNRKRPKAGASTYHQGVDIAVATGTSVMATSGGKVTSAGWQSGYGYVVYIDHGNGVVSRYGHLSKILVKVGQSVSQGDVIARSGNTGNSTGPHLHFEIRVNGTSVNPLNYLNG